ncbi:MAG: methylenetetrahydrofolate reductase C-terminal domain-containing protein [Candidatus Marinimicrobia bacterium]|nr:methylenetetrahydrofolate reductase C-terminal domain-containing protein [Candidatus Neomarinimicrobiota bacterium]
MERLRDIIKSGKFVIGAELVTTRGKLQQKNGQMLLKLAEDLSIDERLDWISLTDNAGGNPMIAPDIVARQVLQRGKNVVVNITCKDSSRNMLESLAWKYASEGIENMMVLTGDYPVDGYRGIAYPVFDLDSVGLLEMLTDMNTGLRVNSRKSGRFINLGSTDFFLGCTVSPFKLTEAELVMQYEKLRLKLKTGADFIIPQMGYDIRKSHELLCFLKEHKFNVPLIANVYLLSPGVARTFNNGMIAGCVVSDPLLERVNKAKQSADKGKKFFIEFAAKQLVAYKDMGYNGVHIGGFDNYKDFAAILEQAKEYESAPWCDFVKELTNPRANEFYLYVKDESTGLADRQQKNPVYINYQKKNYAKHVTLAYRFCRIVHRIFFSYHSPMFGFCKFIYSVLEKKRLKALNKLAYFNEKMWKVALFGCKECGDCSLPDITYLCPGEQCAKNQRNGPCGGSLNERCELTQREKDCIWVKAYYRNKYYNGNNAGLLNRKPVIKDNSLRYTSGWANCFLLRDHKAYEKVHDENC